MTPTQRATFDAFVAVERREGRPATLREVAKERGCNVSVHEIAQELVAQGFLLRADHGQRRGLYTTVNRCPSCCQLLPHSGPVSELARQLVDASAEITRLKLAEISG